MSQVTCKWIVRTFIEPNENSFTTVENFDVTVKFTPSTRILLVVSQEPVIFEQLQEIWVFDTSVIVITIIHTCKPQISF